MLLDVFIIIEDLKRLSLGSFDLHTSQLQAITGTPYEVPVPKKITSIKKEV